MKHLKLTLFISAFLFVFTGMIISQQTVPGDWGKGSNETEPVRHPEKLPQHLLDKVNSPETNRNPELRLQVHGEIDRFLGNAPVEDIYGLAGVVEESKPEVQPPFVDWYNTDVQIFSGSVNSSTYKSLDMKQGPDGDMYVVVNKPGTPGSFNIYRSPNGGATWVLLTDYDAGSGYIHSVSMLVESRSDSNYDSTRCLVYFTFTQNSNGDNAMLYVLNVKKTGNRIVYAVGTPSGGNKFEFVSACSDGQYYSSATYMHAVCREATNAGVQVGIRHFRSTDWGVNHTGSLINTGYNDYYPTAAFSRENGTNDSLYIAVERRLSSTEYELRLIATHEIPTTNHRVFYITSAVSGIKYEKPAITIVQQNINVPRKILVTCTRNRNPRYHYSSNSGSTWTIDQLMGTSSTVTADFTTCNSDSLTSGGQNVIMGFVTDDGDSVNVKQLTIPPSVTYNYYKRNGHTSSGIVAPSVAIYKTGTIKYASVSYPGLGPANIYYNAEQLVTAVEPINNTVPDKFSLEQNYPNPFNPVTNINFNIPKAGNVKLVVFDAVGKEVATLVNGSYNAGTYKVDFDASHLSTGVYFYRLETDGFTDIKKMMLVK